MSLSQRLNGSKSDGVSGMDAEKYEALIKQLKLLSKSQASLFKVVLCLISYCIGNQAE